MSTDIFPSLPGQFKPKRSEMWNDDIQEAVSGKRTGIAWWTYPRWRWEVSYDFLRKMAGIPEFQTFVNFCLKRQGRAGTFLYADEDDNAVTGQLIGIGDGTTRTFQLVRSFGSDSGGFVEPIWAPNLVSAIHVDAMVLATGGWSVQGWEQTYPGLVTLTTAPAVGSAVTADFSYYFPARFAESQHDFEKVMNGWYKTGAIAFESEK